MQGITSNPLLNYDVTLSEQETSTSSNMTSDVAITGQRMVSIVLCGILLLCAAYLIITLSYFEHRKANGRRNDTGRRYDAPCRLLCLGSAIFALLRYIFHIVEMLEGQFSTSPCAWAPTVKMVSLGGSAVCTYLILWLRQRYFYDAPSLQHLSNNTTRICSYALIFIMVAAALVTITIYFATFSGSELGMSCVAKSTIISGVTGGLYYFLIILFQIILFGLFIYPQLKRHQSVLDGTKNEELRMVKLVGYATLVALATTIVAVILSLIFFSILFRIIDRQVIHILFDFDIMVNLLAVIRSFSDWKDRLAPWMTEREIITERKSKEAVANRTEITSNV